mgnify:CR=1 FL=1
MASRTWTWSGGRGEAAKPIRTAERAAVAEDRDGEENRVTVLVELGEGAEPLVPGGLDHRDGARGPDGRSIITL